MKVKVKGGSLKAPLVEPNTDEDITSVVGWNDDGDFKTDVLRSARKAAIVNSGSNLKRKPDRLVQRQKVRVRRLLYSSDEESEDEEREEEGEGVMVMEGEGDMVEEGKGRGNTNMGTVAQKVPSRFAFSDDDD